MALKNWNDMGFDTLSALVQVVCASAGGAMAVVLIVEDEPPILVLVESVLEQAGYGTLTAGTLAEAQAIIQSSQTLDAVFTDINLGSDHEGGLQIGHMIRQTRPHTPVVYTSGRGLTDGMRALFTEPSAFLPKPYTNEQLIEVLASLIREKE
jgi:CheY-like chemotaxis protein